MGLSLNKFIKRSFLVKDVLVLDPMNNPELTPELYREMLEFERQLHGLEDTNEATYYLNLQLDFGHGSK